MPSRSRPTRLAPSHSTFRTPGSSGPANGVATHFPSLRIRTLTSAGPASSKLKAILSARPSALGENASRAARTPPSVRLTASWVVAVAWRPPVAIADSSIWKMPSGSAAGSKRIACSPARFQALPAIVATSAPRSSRAFTVTLAAEVSVYVIVVASATSSSFGETVSGSAARPATERAASPPPIAPIAGVTVSSELIA